MNGNRMNSNQWIALECLIVLAIIGMASFFWEPKYGVGLGMIISAIVAALGSLLFGFDTAVISAPLRRCGRCMRSMTTCSGSPYPARCSGPWWGRC